MNLLETYMSRNIRVVYISFHVARVCTRRNSTYLVQLDVAHRLYFIMDESVSKNGERGMMEGKIDRGTIVSSLMLTFF